MRAAFRISDIKSGFLIFLIALPLCLGIAIASSFPPVAGIFTAIIGGIVASFLGSSRLSIKGPAAGLIIIILSAVQELGQGDVYLGYKRCLAVGVAAAILQIIFSRMGAGKVGSLMPPSVVHGMLAAIGVIIIAKQVHILLGAVPQAMGPLRLIGEIPNSILGTNPEIAVMGGLTLSTILLLPLIPGRITKKFPPALIALCMVSPLAMYWQIDAEHDYTLFGRAYTVGPKLLVNLPESLIGSITFPDFTALTSFIGWKFVIMLALIGSLESLLTVTAIDSLDPQKKKSNLDSDLFAVGVGNLLSAMVGGMPMISEVVRSKANIDNGAQSHWSNFFHGLFLLLAVTFLGSLIHEIPLSALAAMLIITGYRLASPREFYNTYKIGSDQLLFFATTMIVTLATDLLIGVLVGVALKIFVHILRGTKLVHVFRMPIQITEHENTTTMQIQGSAIFSNYLYLSSRIEHELARGRKLFLDLSGVTVVDHSTLSRLKHLEATIGTEKMNIVGLQALQAVSSHEMATHRFA